MRVNIGQRVKTNKQHDKTFEGEAFEGVLVDSGDDWKIAYVQLDCGCIKQIGTIWLKKVDSKCKC